MTWRLGVAVEEDGDVLERGNQPLEVHRVGVGQHDHRELGHEDAPRLVTRTRIHPNQARQPTTSTPRRTRWAGVVGSAAASSATITAPVTWSRRRGDLLLGSSAPARRTRSPCRTAYDKKVAAAEPTSWYRGTRIRFRTMLVTAATP